MATKFEFLPSKVDSEIREKENLIQKKRPAFIKAKEKSTHLNKKVEGAKKSLKQAEKAYKSHKTDVEELETELVSCIRVLFASGRL